MTPMPSRPKLPMASTAKAPTQLAAPRSRLKNSATTTRITTARANEYSTANAELPAMKVTRRMGAMKVLSIVPSQRSQETMKATESNTLFR